ncbi:MAG: hypothetical protein IT386_06440 [Deltaproteobacteria bacterium]|nr:hypothetical protein [Deltaproteobacteria bacterium]
MDHDERVLADRRRALEEAFFKKQNEKLRAKLAAEKEREAARRELHAAFPNAPGEILDRFIEHGLDTEAVAALGLVPCVMVAWAGGRVGEREREAVLALARDNGLAPGGKPHTLLAGWLTEQPSASLVDLWSHYVAALCKGLTPAERDRVRDRIVGLSREVARTSGGFLGLGDRVSDEEAAVIERIEQAFRV